MGDFTDATAGRRLPSVEPSSTIAGSTQEDTAYQTQYDTIVIGAGQAGLAAGYHLAKRGKPFVILEAADRVGGSWLNRWDSLRLFTPATHDGLPGMPFAGGYGFPTTDELIAYLESYAEQFDLPVRTGVRVDGLFREGDGFRVTAGSRAYDAQNVVLATGVHRGRDVPAFADRAVPGHRAAALGRLPQPGTAPGRAPCSSSARATPAPRSASRSAPRTEVLLAGRNVGYICRSTSAAGRAGSPSRSSGGRGSTSSPRTRSPGARCRRKRSRATASSLIRQKEKDLVAAGIERIARIAAVVDGRPQTEDGDVLDVANVIWCTGFVPDFGWVDLPGLDSSGRLATDARPRHRTAGPLRARPGVPVHVQLPHRRRRRQGRGVRRRADRQAALGDGRRQPERDRRWCARGELNPHALSGTRT